MSCDVARIASSAALFLSLPSLSSFRNLLWLLFPLLASYYPLPVWLLVTIGCCSPYPFSLLIHLVVSVWWLTSQLCSRAADHHACSLAHWHRWLKQLALSLCYLSGIVAVRSFNSYFFSTHFNFNHLVLYLFILREVTKRGPGFDSGPAWTACGLGQ